MTRGFPAIYSDFSTSYAEIAFFDIGHKVAQVSSIQKIKPHFISKLCGISVWGGLGCANEDETSKSTPSGLICPISLKRVKNE